MLKKFKEKECPKDKIGEWDEENHFPVDVWKKLGQEGILGACFPEEFGGIGGNIVDETLITEEISNSFSAMGLAYLTGVCFGGMSILHYGTEEQKQKYLPKLIAGDWNFALSLTEPGGGTDVLGALKARAVEQPDGSYLGNGSKIFTTGLHVANTDIYICRTDDVEGKPARGMSVFLIDRDNIDQQETDGDLLNQKFSQGITYHKIKKLGSHILASFEVAFEDVKLSQDQMLGDRGKGFYNLLTTLNNERIVCSATCMAWLRDVLKKQISMPLSVKHLVNRLASFRQFSISLLIWLQRSSCRGLLLIKLHGFRLIILQILLWVLLQVWRRCIPLMQPSDVLTEP